MTYSTYGVHSFVAGFSGQSTLNPNVYTIADSIATYIPSTRQIDRNIQTSISTANANNVFWITDTIADTHEFILLKHGYDTDRVGVAWQFDGAMVFLKMVIIVMVHLIVLLVMHHGIAQELNL